MPFALFNVINTFYSNQYFLSQSTTNVDEITSKTVVFTATTSGVHNGTVLYYSINAVTGFMSASDFDDGTLTGTFAINNSVGTVTKSIRQDFTTEGTESFRMNLRLDSVSGPIVASSDIITIADTSQTPTFTLTADKASVNEGESITFTITTTNVSPGTPLYWFNNGTSTGNDFTSPTSGSVVLSGTLSSASASVTLTTAADLLTEGSQTIVFVVRTDSLNGPTVATLTRTINDTSLTPRGSVAFTTPGTYSWTVPAGVRSISAVVIGGGGGGKTRSGTILTNGSGGSGAGGNLSYRNNFAVTPGTVYTVVVGAGGSASEGGGEAAPSGGISLIGPNTLTEDSFLFASGGGGGRGSDGNYVGGPTGLLGSQLGTTRFRGGRGADGGITFGIGGGGAAGYSGNGGDGGRNSSNPADPGVGGGSGGGGYTTGNLITGQPRTGGKGGGTGILGTGTNGAAGTATGTAFAGNGGNGSQFTDSGAFGQGAASAWDNDESLIADPTRLERLTGGGGAVRIVWPGDARSYPSPGND